MTAAMSADTILQLNANRTYNVSTWPGFTSTSRLRIEGNNAKLVGLSGVDFLSPQANFEINDVRFEDWQSAVMAPSPSNDLGAWKITNCEGTNFSSIFAYVVGISTGYQFNDNILDGTGRGPIIGDNIFARQDQWSGELMRNQIRNMSHVVGGTIPGILAYGLNTTIGNNVIENITNSGAGEAWGIYPKLRNSLVHDNTVDGVHCAGGSGVGINIKGVPDGVSVQGHGTTARGNTVRNITGVSNTCIRVQTHETTVDDNDVFPNLYGILVDVTTHPATDTSITDNRAVGNSTANSRGIFLAGTNGNNILISGNTASLVTNGIDSSPGGSMDNLRIINNPSVQGLNVGISISGLSAPVTNIEVSGNAVSGTHDIYHTAGSGANGIKTGRIAANTKIDLVTPAAHTGAAYDPAIVRV